VRQEDGASRHPSVGVFRPTSRLEAGPS